MGLELGARHRGVERCVLCAAPHLDGTVEDGRRRDDARDAMTKRQASHISVLDFADFDDFAGT